MISYNSIFIDRILQLLVPLLCLFLLLSYYDDHYHSLASGLLGLGECPWHSVFEDPEGSLGSKSLGSSDFTC